MLVLRSNYHLVAIKPSDKTYTAFEAGGPLYQFHSVPLELINNIPSFRLIIDKFISKENLQRTYAYIVYENVNGKDRFDHDKNLGRFMATVKTV